MASAALQQILMELVDLFSVLPIYPKKYKI